MDRRHFLTTAFVAVGALTGADASSAPAAAASAATPRSTFKFSQSVFRNLVGSQFRLRSRSAGAATGSWQGHVQLTEVLEGPVVPGLDQFTTVFTCDASAAPPAGLYDVDHPETGRFLLGIDRCKTAGRREATFALRQA